MVQSDQEPSEQPSAPAVSPGIVSTHGVFIAGTDTGIGKTHASCALLHALRGAGLRAVGMKPVASGCEQINDTLRNADAEALIAASNPRPAYADVNPLALRAPVSPHLAAREDGKRLDLPAIESAYARLRALADWVVVEGIGGWDAPLSEEATAAVLAQTLELPVILVVGLRLGCLSHASLSARAIRADGCHLLGWIGNTLDPDMHMIDANIHTLEHLLPAPCLGVLGHDPAPETAAAHLHVAVSALLRPGQECA